MELIGGDTKGLLLPRGPASTSPQAGRGWEASIPGRTAQTKAEIRRVWQGSYTK